MKAINENDDNKVVNDNNNRVDLTTKCGLGVSKSFNFGNMSIKEEGKSNGD